MRQPFAFPEWWVPVMLPVVWVLVSVMISTLGGWSRLAARFRTDDRPPPNIRRMQSGTFGSWCHYNNILTVGYSETGLYLAVFFLFRVFHPPLLIPWSAIEKRTRSTYWFVKCDTLEIEGLRLRLRAAITEPFAQYLPAVSE